MNSDEINTDREFEEGAAGTIKDRKNDPLKEYSEKEPMTPAKIKKHEPTAVKRDPNDETIVEEDFFQWLLLRLYYHRFIRRLIGKGLPVIGQSIIRTFISNCYII